MKAVIGIVILSGESDGMKINFTDDQRTDAGWAVGGAEGGGGLRDEVFLSRAGHMQAQGYSRIRGTKGNFA